MGKYAQAEPYYQRALEITRTVRGESHTNVAASLNNLAILYQEMGDYSKALSFSQQANTIVRMAVGEKHPDFANSLSNLASIYHELGEYVQAEQLLHEALEIQRMALGKAHPALAGTLNNLAALGVSAGDYTQAEAFYQQALKILRTTIGEAHSDVARILYNLAGLYHRMGDYIQTEKFFLQALDIWRTVLGEIHPYIANCLNDLALLYGKTNRSTEIMALLLEAADIDDLMIGQVFSIGSESRRMMYLKTLRQHFDLFLSLILRYFPDSRTAVESGLNLVLHRKAIEAEALAAQRDAILGGRYTSLRSKLHELTTLRAQIAQKTLDGSGSEDILVYKQTLKVWTDQKEQLEIELARQIPEVSLSQQLRVAKWQGIVEALPLETALVEFIRVNLFDLSTTFTEGHDHYLAFVLNSGEHAQIRLVDLGEAEHIDKLIGLFRVGITGEFELGNLPSEVHGASPLQGSDVKTSEGSNVRHTSVGSPLTTRPSYREQGLALRKVIFDPLLEALGGRRKLFLSPDGDITRLPFEVMPTEEDSHLLDDYQISYLSTGRDVLRFGIAFTMQPATPLVIADPDFDLQVDAAPLLNEARAVQEERYPLDMGRAGFPFARLTGTRKEGEQIARMLNMKPMLERDALESQIKSSRSPRILHIASHGFFLPNTQRDTKNYVFGDVITARESKKDNLLPAEEVENPLLRSGLALAGANNWRHKDTLPVGAEDGLLFAEDVSGLDLLDTELVILSACETGLGEVRIGEGVFGLRRAFVLAGARRLVMSLWKVPDQETQEVMVDFYRNLLDGCSGPDALRLAQRAMRERNRHPYYWGPSSIRGTPRRCHRGSLMETGVPNRGVHARGRRRTDHSAQRAAGATLSRR